MRILVLVPVFNDWPSATRLLTDLDRLAGDRGESYSVLMVNDGSTDFDSFDPEFIRSLSHLNRVQLVHLVSNFGHARAIAVGLAFVADREEVDAVLVMDSDGEDRPQDVGRLIDALENEPGSAIVARREHRSEGPGFRISYSAYKTLFSWLTGSTISFGNFCLLPRAIVRKLVYVPDLWSHLAACLLKSRLPLVNVPTSRGDRYFGSSKMNLVSLVQHGMGAIAVYLETVLVRILLALVAFFAAIFTGMLIVVGVRLATDLAIPGWASTVFGVLSILLVQSIIFSILLVFTSLKNRAATITVPALHYRDYIADVDELHE
jgi:glycosyltransferase involved in cell wall biosynthesis